MEKNSITKLFEDVPLYEKKEFKLYTKIDDDYSIIEDENLIKIYEYLGLLSKKENLITDCIICEGRFPFTKQIECKNYIDYENLFYVGKCEVSNGLMELNINFNNTHSFDKYKILNNSIGYYTYYIDYYFNCTNDVKHLYKMSVSLFRDSEKVTITKIGQFPESTILGEYDGDKYTKILRRINDSYLEYKNSEKSYKYGLYSGAYVYLRRVFENMIDYYIKKNNIELSQGSKTEDRIDAVKGCFDDKIRDILKPLYSALSKGIHSIKDQECKEYYNELKVVLDIQLQYMKSNDELEMKVKESSKVLAELNAKYKGK